MEVYDAIYSRQSLDKADSISVDSQIEFCKKEVVSENLKIYTDKGYSGKNLDRPAFKTLMGDINAGKINRVIVYRLDRISRSVLDFANLISIFQKNKVDFVSTMEKFDTGTPIGKAMLMIVMVFAQLERETIQRRIIDAYSSRSKRGFYMGGNVPYGFKLKDTVIDGVRTKMYEANIEEAAVIEFIFNLYKEPQTSFGDVTKALAEKGIKKRDGKTFSRGRIRDIVINPIYVKADYKIYDFYKKYGSVLINIPEDFIGENGAYLYSGESEIKKSLSLKDHILVLAPHRGLVDSGTWLKCRMKCMNNAQLSMPRKAGQSWLSGKIKCGICGYALVAKSYKRKTMPPSRYFLCNNNSSEGCTFRSLKADLLEKIVLEEIKKKLDKFEALSKAEVCTNYETLKIRHELTDIDAEINALISKIPSSNNTLIQYINQRISELDLKKKELCTHLMRVEAHDTARTNKITGYMESWDTLTTADKMHIADSLIEMIYATEKHIKIKWKI